MADLELNVTSKIMFYRSHFSNLQADARRNVVNIYDDLTEEYKILNKGVGLRDISHLGIIELQGKDSIDFLNRISTNALAELKSGFSDVTLFTNEKGRIIERTTIYNFGDFVLLICSDYFKQKLFSWINKYVVMEDIKLFDLSGQYSLFELLGPQANSFSTLFFDGDIDQLSYNQFKNFSVENNEFFALKKKETGIDKFLLLGKPAQGSELVKLMLEQKSVFDFRLVGEAAYEKYRIEKGIPSAPNEINDSYNPYEAGLINEVSLTKGRFIGQEVIARINTSDKSQKILMGIIFNSAESSKGNVVIYDGQNEIGKSTSITYSLSMQKNIGLAYIKKEYSDNGNVLTAKSEDGMEYPVTISALPFKK